MTSFCGLCYEITENSKKKDVGMGLLELCKHCTSCLHTAILTPVSLHPSTVLESVLYTSSIHRNVTSYTYRKTIPELESLCLCSEGMGVPVCMQV